MGGTTMHKPVFKQLEYLEVQSFGKHGIRIFNKQYVPTKLKTDTGNMEHIFMETRRFTELLWQF
jgi:hypothetical protein